MRTRMTDRTDQTNKQTLSSSQDQNIKGPNQWRKKGGLLSPASSSALLPADRSTVRWCPSHSARISTECFESTSPFMRRHSPACTHLVLLQTSLGWPHLTSTSHQSAIPFHIPCPLKAHPSQIMWRWLNLHLAVVLYACCYACNASCWYTSEHWVMTK